MLEKKPTAAYKVLPGEDGNRYRFFCDLSGMAVITNSVGNAGKGTIHCLSQLRGVDFRRHVQCGHLQVCEMLAL